MLMSKKNVVVYTIQLDTEWVKKEEGNGVWTLLDMFKKEFEKEGLKKEAERMDKGGFSYKETERNSYYTEYEISITTRTKII